MKRYHRNNNPYICHRGFISLPFSSNRKLRRRVRSPSIIIAFKYFISHEKKKKNKIENRWLKTFIEAKLNFKALNKKNPQNYYNKKQTNQTNIVSNSIGLSEEYIMIKKLILILHVCWNLTLNTLSTGFELILLG